MRQIVSLIGQASNLYGMFLTLCLLLITRQQLKREERGRVTFLSTCCVTTGPRSAPAPPSYRLGAALSSASVSSRI